MEVLLSKLHLLKPFSRFMAIQFLKDMDNWKYLNKHQSWETFLTASYISTLIFQFFRNSDLSESLSFENIHFYFHEHQFICDVHDVVRNFVIWQLHHFAKAIKMKLRTRRNWWRKIYLKKNQVLTFLQFPQSSGKHLNLNYVPSTNTYMYLFAPQNFTKRPDWKFIYERISL